MRWRLAVCVLGLLIAACGSDDAGETNATVAVETTGQETTESTVDCRANVSNRFQVAYEIPGPNDVTVTCDLVYKTSPSGLDQTLDVYVPTGTGTTEALPAVIFFHFNGDPEAWVWPGSREEPFTADFKTDLDNQARVVASLGLVGITFNYSSYPMRSDFGTVNEENMGFAAQDATDLLAYVADNADELNVDPARICVWTRGTGSMVGAYTALAGEPQPVCAVMFGGTLDEDFAGKYNPADLVSAEMPPFFIVRGNQDIHSNDAIDRFAFLDREAGGDRVTVERVLGGHAFDVFPQNLAETQAAIGEALDFVMEQLGVTAS